MADKKISQLAAASTPLAGTEVLPIVQSSTTVKVAISDVTAGRDISAASVTLSTGNLIVGTAGKGIDFSANSSAAGMTSELLTYYEEGTFTPSLLPGTSGSITLDTAAGKYTRIGRSVTVTGVCSVLSVSSPVGVLQLRGLPYTNAADNGSRSTGVIYGTGLAATAVTSIVSRIIPSEAQIRIEKFAAGSASAMAGDVQAGALFQFSLTYFV